MTGRYTPDRRGTRQFMHSRDVGRAMGSVAEELASQANLLGRGAYTASQRTVQGGGGSTVERAGAEVRETQRHWADVNVRRLVNVTNRFRMRGGR